MKEDDSNWFSKWEEQLPSPEELMPLSQTLITPNLAYAFNIQNPTSLTRPQPNSSELCDGGGSDEQARTLKRPRLVWTPQLHKRFLDAVAHLGIKNAVPKTIMQFMSVDGLTREKVASHLQKYRLYLKRLQGVNNNNNNVGIGSGDPVMDRLFASSPVPAHFLHPNSDGFVSYIPVVGVHHQQMVTVAGQAHRQLGHYGSAQVGGLIDHLFLSKQAQLGPIRNGGNGQQGSYLSCILKVLE